MSRAADAVGIGDEETALLVGHGSRRDKSNEAVRELAEPSIPDAIGTLAHSSSRITMVPLSLFAASHVKNDLPLAVKRARSEHPGVTFHAGAHLGIHPAILDLLDDRARNVETELGVDRDDDDVAVVVCARGSSDPDSNADAHKLARLLYEGRSFDRVEAGSSASPNRSSARFSTTSRRRDRTRSSCCRICSATAS